MLIIKQLLITLTIRIRQRRGGKQKAATILTRKMTPLPLLTGKKGNINW